MLRFIGVVLCAMVLGGCNGEAADPTTTRAPQTTTSHATGGDSALQAVTSWLDALSIGRYPVADELVVENQFVLILAVESFSLDVYQDLASEGISPDVSRTFWESFVAGVQGFTGANITEVDVVGAQAFEAYGRRFAEVEASSPRGDLTIVAVLEPDGKWYVDLLATFGQSFAPLFNPWVDRLPSGETAPIQALAGQMASLEVARDRAVGAAGREARMELDALLGRLRA